MAAENARLEDEIGSARVHFESFSSPKGFDKLKIAEYRKFSCRECIF